MCFWSGLGLRAGNSTLCTMVSVEVFSCQALIMLFSFMLPSSGRAPRGTPLQQLKVCPPSHTPPEKKTIYDQTRHSTTKRDIL